jgi:hypothetical protein
MFTWYCFSMFSMSFICVLFMLHLLTVCNNNHSLSPIWNFRGCLFCCSGDLCGNLVKVDDSCNKKNISKIYKNVFSFRSSALCMLFLCALYVCLCEYVNICMYLVLLHVRIFGKKLLRACVYCYTKTEFKKVFLPHMKF